MQESKQQAVTCVTEVRDSPAAVLDGGGDRAHRVRAEGSQFTADMFVYKRQDERHGRGQLAGQQQRCLSTIPSRLLH